MTNDYIQNEREMGEYIIITEFMPYDDETDEEWGWFWSIVLSEDKDCHIDKYNDILLESNAINFGPFPTEDLAIKSAMSAWDDVLGAPGQMVWLSSRSLDERLKFNAFVLGVSMDEYNEMNERGEY